LGDLAIGRNYRKKPNGIRKLHSDYTISKFAQWKFGSAQQEGVATVV
jgi:hypothetical protein